MSEKDDLENKIAEMFSERDVLLDELKDIDSAIITVQEQLLDMDDKYVKCKCTQCDGKGWIQEDNNKKVCSTCKQKGYIWLEKYN